MMLAALIALSAPVAEPTGAQLISKMFALYHDAPTLRGDIVCTQSAQNVTVTTRTTLQLERPNRLYILQTRDGSQGGRWKVAADGLRFSYDRPKGIGGKARFLEPMTMRDGTKLGIEDVYTAVIYSLGDKSAPLDIAIGRRDDLRGLVKEWDTNFVVKGTQIIRGITGNIITGGYHPFPGSRNLGYLEMVIADDGTLLRYFLRDRVSVTDVSKEAVTVETNFEVSLKIGAELDPSLFTNLN
jgi:hypothetical protein